MVKEMLEVYSSLNGTIAASGIWNIDLLKETRQSKGRDYLPANIIMVKNSSIACDIGIYLNQYNGSDYYKVPADGEIVIEGSNVWAIFIENLNAATAVTAGDINLRVKKEEVE